MAKPTTSKESQQMRASELQFPPILRGKKILLATESLGPINGVSRTTSNLINYLRSHSVRVAIVAPHQAASLIPKSPLIPQNPNDDPEIRLHGFPLPYDPTLSIVFPFRLDRIFRKTSVSPASPYQLQFPDLIYLASPASLGFQVLLQHRQLPRKAQPPILLNFQTDLSAYCEILFPRPLDHWAVWVLRSVQGVLFSFSAVKTVFYPSSYVERYLLASGVQPEKLINLRRGVDTDMFEPEKRDEAYRNLLAPKKEIILITVARLAPEKGFDFLAKAARQLALQKEKGMLNFDFKLVIVGGNRNAALSAEIRSLFETKELYGKVEFTGLLQGAELARAYASADIFLHSSITETFGLVVLEAMASSIPVIARDMGGPSDIVLDSDTGYLVDPDDLSGFVAKIEELAGNEELRTGMGRRGREVALQATWEAINNKVAWQMAKALEEQQLESSDLSALNEEIESIQSISKSREGESETEPLLPGPGGPSNFRIRNQRPVKTFFLDIGTRLRILGSVVLIWGVWGGLLITWGLVNLGLMAKRLKFW